MNLTIFGLSLGTLPGWVPVWAVPAAIIHIALFLALIIPTWVALARARSGGPLALVLILPVLGLLMLCPIFMNRVLPYAHWARFWGILVLVPGLNIFFLWIFAFAPWKRRYIPMDQEEYSEPQTGMGATGMGARRQAPKLDARTGAPAAQGGSQTMMQGTPARPYSGEPGAQTMFPGAPTPRSGTPLSPRSAEPSPQTMMAGPTGAGRSPSVPSGPPADEPPQATIIAGGRQQQLDEPVQPTPPIPARSQRDPLTSAPTGVPGGPPPSRTGAPPPMAAEPSPPEPPRPEPSRQRPERTQDLTVRNQPPPEAATVRIPQPTRAGGRAWKLIGANEVAKAIEFTIQEAALLESEAGLLVGRSARANFVIDHDSISRNHARFTLERGALMLEDLDSMNGTWVDGNRLEANEPVALQPNGIVEIGKVALRVTGG
jgi:hypothetical protein